MNRENHTATEAVVYPSVIVSDYQPGLFQKFFFVSVLFRFFVKGIPLIETVAQLEFADSVFAESSFGKVAESDRFSFYVFV